MSEYKKKKVKKVKLGKVPSRRNIPRKEVENKDIIMKKEKRTVEKKQEKSVNCSNENRHFKLISGNKTKNSKKSHKLLLICILVLVIIVFINFLTPTGLYETFINRLKATGSGEMPVNLESANVLSTFGDDNRAYILSDTNYEIYNSNGKLLNNVQHGYLKPAMSVSESRSIIYNRGGNKFKILNLSKTLYNGSLKNTIYSAKISRCGVYGFASKASGYASQVSVFDKYNNSIYTLYSADNIIADLAINDSGKKVATAEIFTSGGKYITLINIYSFKSSNPEVSFKIEGAVSTSLINLDSCFAVVCKDRIIMVNWSDGKQAKCEVSGDILRYSYDLDGNFAYVSGRNNDYSTSVIYLYNDDDKINNFSVNYSVKDISVKGKNVFTLNSENVILYNGKNGEQKDIFVSKFTSSDIFAIGSSSVGAVSQSKLVVLE